MSVFSRAIWQLQTAVCCADIPNKSRKEQRPRSAHGNTKYAVILFLKINWCFQDFRRGTAIGEFVGLITKGMDGIDVMQGGNVENPYQIYQGHIGLALTPILYGHGLFYEQETILALSTILAHQTASSKGFIG